MTSPLYTLHLPITGMNCSSCAGKIERTLSRLDGITSASVNLTTARATITSSHLLEYPVLIQAIEQSGYHVPLQELTLDIDGMNCTSCSGKVERSLNKIPSVISAKVNLTTNKAYITGLCSPEELIHTVKKTGFSAKIPSENFHDENKKDIHINNKKTLFTPLIASSLSCSLIAFLSMSSLIPNPTNTFIQWILTTFVLFVPGSLFLRTGIPSLLRGTPSMYSLVSLGSLSAYIYSSIVIFFPQLFPKESNHLYLDTTVDIITFILIGRTIETKARARTSKALKKLSQLQPQTAHVLRENVFSETSLKNITIGDIIKIRPGERIPLDGYILSGSSHIDESMLTGEAIPVARSTGDNVSSGTLNQEGTLTFQATAVGHDTILSRIIQMVEKAQGSKLPIQSLADKVTLWFVPVIIGLSLLTFILWFFTGPEPHFPFALVNSISVLIAACPCAMGLATPTALMVGTGKAAEMGILFRKGDALQTLESIHTIAFDKTGTLTEGHPTLTHLYCHPAITEDEALKYSAALEVHSEHPIARALVKASQDRSFSLPEVNAFKAVPGMGVEAYYNTTPLHLGSSRYMERLNFSTQYFSQETHLLAQKGHSLLYLAVDHQVVALLSVSDPIRPSAPRTIRELKKRGIHVAMITGDHDASAHHIAQQANIDTIIPNALPHEKSQHVARLQKKYGTLAFVGDGINDAPALAQADVGIAVSHGTDIAIETADLVLTTNTLESTISAISLSHATLRIIRQNLFWAFAYNIILIPVAAGALYPITHKLFSPMFAAAAMALSSIFVVFNTLRLGRFKVS